MVLTGVTLLLPGFMASQFLLGCIENATRLAWLHVRRLYGRKALRRDVANPQHGQQGHGTAIDRDLPGATNHRLASTSTPLRQAGLCLSQAQSCGARRWLLLARLSAARRETQEQRRVLAKENHRESDARSARHENASGTRLARAANLGTRAYQEKRAKTRQQTQSISLPRSRLAEIPFRIEDYCSFPSKRPPPHKR